MYLLSIQLLRVHYSVSLLIIKICTHVVIAVGMEQGGDVGQMGDVKGTVDAPLQGKALAHPQDGFIRHG